MTSETDAEFVSDMEWLHSHDREAALPPEKLARLFDLARRGAAAEFLFGLLDDIDTADDIAKGNEAYYRQMVRNIHRRRFEVASTDGYTVTFFPTPASRRAGT